MMGPVLRKAGVIEVLEVGDCQLRHASCPPVIDRKEGGTTERLMLWNSSDCPTTVILAPGNWQFQ